MEQELTNIFQDVCATLKIEQYDFYLNNESINTEGFLSEFYTGTIIDKVTGDTISVAIKRAPQKAGVFPQVELLYRNEDFFYSKLFPALQTFQNEKKLQKPFNNIPKYFCSSTEPGKQYIAMQNIKNLGYRLTEKSDFLDQNHLNLMFETYGKFHALSFAFKDQQLNKYNEIMKHSVDVVGSIKETDPIVESIENNVLSVLKTFDDSTGRTISNKLEGIGNIKTVLLDGLKYNGHHGCIIHGDCWSNNMLFKYQESGELEDMKLLDFQFTKESSPVHDLLLAFYSSGSSEDFKMLDIYLDKYYSSFSTFVKELGSDPEKVYPKDILKAEWKQFAIMGAFLGIDLWVPKLMDRKDITELRNTDNKSAEETQKNVEEYMDVVRKSDLFKDRTRQIILHLNEYGFL